jgi:hypothetical protein
MQRLWATLFEQCTLRRRTLVVLLVLLVLVVVHSPILQMLAWPLQAADSSTSNTCFCLHGGELGIDGFKALDRAAEWHRETGGTVLLIIPRANRLVELGAAPSFEQTCRRGLAKRGVPDADVNAIHADARNTWDEARALGEWLDQHPQATVSLACSPFAGGRLRYVLNKVLYPHTGSRERLAALADTTSAATAWWRSRSGVKDFMYAWLDLAYAWCAGDDAPAVQPSAATFRMTVAAEIGEAPR